MLWFFQIRHPGFSYDHAVCFPYHCPDSVLIKAVLTFDIGFQLVFVIKDLICGALFYCIPGIGFFGHLRNVVRSKFPDKQTVCFGNDPWEADVAAHDAL